MSAIISRWRSNAAPGAGTSTTTSSPLKSKPQDSSISDNIIDNTHPIRHDGSDKSFGMHNPSNTCYANSVLQCLYFSEQFRHNVVGFPAARNPLDSTGSPSLKPRLNLETENGQPTVAGAQAHSPLKPPADARSTALQRSSSGAGTTQSTSGGDKQESFDERKKQIMAAGPHVRSEANHNSYGMPISLFTSLKDLFEAMIVHQARTGVVVPARFMEQLREDHAEYKSPQHQDAHEFLNLLLNAVVDKTEEFSKDVATRTNSHPTASPVEAAVQSKASWIRDLFQGTLTSETRCLTCENISQRDEIFLDLSVDLEEHSSVSSCLQRFSQEEMLCERNKFECDKCCGLQEAEKRMKIRKLPRILALHLKRFKYDENWNLQKLFHRVVFPFHLRLFNTTDDAEDPDRLYELYAIIVHLGSTPFHGHYVSIIKTKDRGWVLFDDELVLPVDTNYIRNFFGGQRSPACAYVLFYQETTVEAATREDDVEEDAPKTFAEASGLVGQHIMSPTTPGVEESGFTFDQGSPNVRPTSADERELSKTLESPSNHADVRQPSGHLGARKSGEINVPKSSFELPPSVTSVFRSKDSKKSSEISERLLGHEAGATAAAEAYAHSEAKGPVHGDDAHNVVDDGKPLDHATAGRHNSKKSGGLSRFRATSFSMKSKSKFWGSKGGDKDHKDVPEPESHEHDAPSKSPEKDRGAASMKTNFFRQDKPKKTEKSDYEVAAEEAQANEPLLATSTSDHQAPPSMAAISSPKHEKEKSSLSKLWSRSEKTDKQPKHEPREAFDEVDEPDGAQHSLDTAEKSVKHRASRFGLGRKKSGNALG